VKKKKFDELFKDIIEEVKATRDDGQKEYAHTEDDVFANFQRVASSLDISKEKALMVYLMKHMDGINAYIKGHKSQRENVTGRIKDAIVYLCLLWGMVDDDKIQPNTTTFNPKTGEVSYQTVGDEVV
jgi:predicted AAA+ superfamily ATPase